MYMKAEKSQVEVTDSMKKAISVLVQLMYEYRFADFCKDERWVLVSDTYYDVFGVRLPVAARYLLRSRWANDPQEEFLLCSFAQEASRVGFDAIGFWDQ